MCGGRDTSRVATAVDGIDVPQIAMSCVLRLTSASIVEQLVRAVVEGPADGISGGATKNDKIAWKEDRNSMYYGDALYQSYILKCFNPYAAGG